MRFSFPKQPSNQSRSKAALKTTNIECHHLFLEIHFLNFTTVSTSLVFDFFQIYLKQFWDLVVHDFVENFKCYFLVIKITSITEIKEKKS